MWLDAWSSKEAALRTRFTRTSEALNRNIKPLTRLKVGDRCFIQNQTGIDPKKWHRTGLVVEVLEHDQYLIKVDGSGRITRRNRRFLRSFEPASMTIEHASSPQTTANPAPDELPPPTTQSPGDRNRQNTFTPTPLIIQSQREEESILAPPPPEELPPTTPQQEMATQPTITPSIPAALKRILPFNSTGHKETPLALEEGVRPRRGDRNAP